MNPLAGWENFYVIVGSSAGALIGLQFVVVTLIAELRTARDVERGTNAFATPTIVHFGAVLLLAAVITVPWHGVFTAAVVWGIVGIVGMVYVLIVGRRIRTQTGYKPQFEDQLFHFILPFAAYATLALFAYAARSNIAGALLAVAAATLVLLFSGIHNAWDAVTYHVFIKSKRLDGSE